MRHTVTAILPTLAIVMVLLISLPCLATGQQPDFSGVWTWYLEPGENPFRPVLPDLPLRPEVKKKVDEYRELVSETGDNPSGWCLGTGMPGSMLGSGGYPMEVIQRPEQITIIYEAHQEIRRIYIGSNRFPEEDMFPDRNGYSEGRWKGDRLIVETTHLKEQLDQIYAHSNQARILEEYYLSQTDDNKKILIAEMTMTDPEFYSEPVTATKKWLFVPGSRLLPYECNEPDWEQHIEDLRRQSGDRNPE